MIDSLTLQVDSLPTGDLVPYVGNVRTHTPEQVKEIANSIQEFGFTNPILLDESGGIIAGHGRVMAAESLGMETVPTITLSHLSDAQKRAYRIADNQLALNAGWNDELLADELRALNGKHFDLTLTGFDSGYLDDLLSGVPDFQPTDEDDQPRLDEKSPVICPHCGKNIHNESEA